MKKIFTVFILLAAIQFQAQAQDNKATVYFLRGDGPDTYVPYFTYVNDSLLCKLGRGKFSVHTIDAGTHRFHAQYKGKIESEEFANRLPVQIEPGKTYYIAVKIATKAFGKGKFYCELLTEEAGKERVGVFREDKDCQ